MYGGRCACSAVTYTMKSEPMFVHCCNCTDCQRLTGSAYAVNALIETDRIEVSGELWDVKVGTPSGHGQLIKRCAACGTAIYSHYLARGKSIAFLRVGTLDDPSACEPDVNIWTADKRPWAPLNEAIPNFEAFYRAEDVWPSEAFARRTTVLADHGSKR